VEAKAPKPRGELENGLVAVVAKESVSGGGEFHVTKVLGGRRSREGGAGAAKDEWLVLHGCSGCRNREPIETWPTFALSPSRTTSMASTPRCGSPRPTSGCTVSAFARDTPHLCKDRGRVRGGGRHGRTLFSDRRRPDETHPRFVTHVRADVQCRQRQLECRPF
jgi:hypothetical protein